MLDHLAKQLSIGNMTGNNSFWLSRDGESVEHRLNGEAALIEVAALYGPKEAFFRRVVAHALEAPEAAVRSMTQALGAADLGDVAEVLARRFSWGDCPQCELEFAILEGRADSPEALFEAAKGLVPGKTRGQYDSDDPERPATHRLAIRDNLLVLGAARFAAAGKEVPRTFEELYRFEALSDVYHPTIPRHLAGFRAPPPRPGPGPRRRPDREGPPPRRRRRDPRRPPGREPAREAPRQAARRRLDRIALLGPSRRRDPPPPRSRPPEAEDRSAALAPRGHAVLSGPGRQTGHHGRPLVGEAAPLGLHGSGAPQVLEPFERWHPPGRRPRGLLPGGGARRPPPRRGGGEVPHSPPLVTARVESGHRAGRRDRGRGRPPRGSPLRAEHAELGGQGPRGPLRGRPVRLHRPPRRGRGVPRPDPPHSPPQGQGARGRRGEGRGRVSPRPLPPQGEGGPGRQGPRLRPRHRRRRRLHRAPRLVLPHRRQHPRPRPRRLPEGGRGAHDSPPDLRPRRDPGARQESPGRAPPRPLPPRSAGRRIPRVRPPRPRAALRRDGRGRRAEARRHPRRSACILVPGRR